MSTTDDTSGTGESIFQFDSLFQPEFSRRPQPYYQHMRATNPILRTPSMYGDDRTIVWVAKRDDVDQALRCPEVFSSKFGDDELVPLIPENIDPPDHLKYRRLLDPMFGPKQMNALEPAICQRANDLIDAFIDRGECDYAEEFAVPLPCTVFLELVGLPLDDLGHFLRLKEAILRGGGGSLMSQDDPVRRDARNEASERFVRLIEDRRREPLDDLISDLVNAEVEGERLSDNELLGICHLLLVAGLDTVTDSLTCFYAFLGRNPEYRDRLVADPALVPAAVEEMLRFESPVPFVPRVVLEDSSVGGCPVAKGDSVILLLGSANTDDASYEGGAQHVDFDRVNTRHLAFGGGIHRCLGSHLARLELRIALREWHRRIPRYHIPDDVELEFAPLLRQVEHLPLVFDEVRG